MSNEIVWASSVMVSPTAKMFFENALVEVPRDPKLDNSSRNEKGEVLSAENFPREVWGVRGLNDSKSLPDIFMGYGPWIVSKAVADVMRQFDMGNGGLYPVRVLKKDRKTPFDGEWFCLNFGNIKKAYVGGGRNPTAHIPKDFIRHAMPYPVKDNQLMVNTDALVGPDIWVDPQIYDTFFVSDRLAKALKDAGVARAFGFKKCSVVGASALGEWEQAA
jgi:hypothetical protein